MGFAVPHVDGGNGRSRATLALTGTVTRCAGVSGVMGQDHQNVERKHLDN